MKKYTNFKYVVILVVFGLLPIGASAATVSVEASRTTMAVGDTAVLTLKVNAEGAVINTIDGEVSFTSPAGSLGVQEFSLANSSFGLWPRTPSLSTDGRTVSFVGGVPGGFSIEGATLFKIVVEAKKEGSITIKPQNISVFANDGNGTKLPVTTKEVVVKVTAQKAGTPVNNEWAGIVSADVTPPEDFIIVMGQDATLFEGKKFAFFSALDNQSGIDHYDVSENGAPTVRSGSTYVLQNQEGDVKLDVVAFDKAGNKKSAMYPTGTTGGGVSWATVIVGVLVILILKMLYTKWRKPKINASPAL